MHEELTSDRVTHREPPKNIPLFAPLLDGNAQTYVQQSIDSGWVSSRSTFVDRFEKEFARKIGARHTVATQSGTAALHLALLLAGVKEGDEVLMPALTFIATANAIRYLGAHPVFIDVERDYFQIDPEKLSDFLKNECRFIQGRWVNRTSRRQVRALVAVHSLGHPCDIRALQLITQDYGIKVIEDAAESLGALYNGKPVGTFGDIATFSFNGNKLLTTGGGGMIACGNLAWARRARHLSTQAKVDEWEMVHDEVAFNYRMGGLSAALGCAQLECLEERVSAKRRIAATYTELLARLSSVQPMKEAPWARSIFWLYTIRLPTRVSPRTVGRKLAKLGIQSRPLWQPLHLSPAHEGTQSYQIEVATEVQRSALCLPSSPSLTEDQQERVVAALQETIRRTRNTDA